MRHTVPLPRGWAVVPLEDLGLWSGGGTPSKEEPGFWNDGRIPWVSPKDMKTLLIKDTQDHITEAALAVSAAKLIPAHSVLMVTRSGILAHTFPVAVNLVPVTVNQDLKTLTPHAGVREMYVAYGLQALGQSILRACSKDGTTVASVDTQELKRVELPVAPHREQRRIVEAIESYLTRLDNAVALLERVEENLKRYRASVLKAAVEGRLVATEAELARREGRSYEPARELLKRILAERKTRWIEDAAEKARAKAEEKAREAGKPWTAKDNALTLEKERARAAKQYKEPAADTTDLPDLPEGWYWATIEAISALVTDGDHNPPKRVEQGVPHLTAKHVKDWRLTTADCSFVSEEGFEQTRARYEPQPGDLIVTCVGTVGEAALVPEGFVFSADRNLAGIRLVSGGAVPEYALAFMSSPDMKRELRGLSGSTAQPHLYLTDLRQVRIPLPPRAEQSRIVEAVEGQLSVLQAVADAIEVQALRATRLRQAILRWSFEGKLVEQDPNDEPASVLLERIRAERAAGTPSTRTKKKRSTE